MKKQIPTIILAIGCLVLAGFLYTTEYENKRLREELAQIRQLAATVEQTQPETEPAAETLSGGTTNQAVTTLAEADPLEVIAESKEDGRRRMMNSMAKMMENPTMNKVMEASQRGAVGALYSDLIEYLNLDKEETQYFMDLLMFRQMKQMDLGMKMMGGNISEEEKKKMAEELQDASETVKTEMEKFLNNPEDFEEFEFYEKTMGERMMLSSMDQKLAGSDAALSDETYREVLSMMHEEKKNFDFTTDLQDEKNMDLSPERFSKENLERFANDMDALNNNIILQAQNMLTAEQLKSLEEAISTTAEMQKAQLEMAAQMFGGEK